MTGTQTWEQAVQWLRGRPEYQQMAIDCYYDDPLNVAAHRFWQSDEWRATRPLLPRPCGGALDLGAGRGIASYALALDGWRVAALEPDPSEFVGVRAIAELARQARLSIAPVRQYAERLPFRDASFDLVYARATLHHARDLSKLCQEVARVLSPSGRLVAVREHVVSNDGQLAEFLDTHPLHRLYGGEHAFRLREYVEAMSAAGLQVRCILGPMDSVVNAAPMTREEWLSVCRGPMARWSGEAVARRVLDERHALGRWMLSFWAKRLSGAVNTPGRLFTFVMERPAK